MNLFTKLFRSRDKPKNYLSGCLSFLFGQTLAGRVVNEQTAMQVTAVYTCVRILAVRRRCWIKPVASWFEEDAFQA